MRTEKEVRDVLERSFLYDGHNVYFSYNDFGSIAFGAVYPDNRAWSERFLDTYERLLSEEDPRGAFCDAVVDGMSVYVDDGRDYLLHEQYLPDHGIELSDGETVPPDVMEAFTREYRDDIERYDGTLELLMNDRVRDGCRELTPALLIGEMQRFDILPEDRELASHYPEIHGVLNAKPGIGFSFDFHGEPVQVELVKESYLNGTLAVTAYLSDPNDDSFGEPWGNVTVNLSSPSQQGATVFLDTNNMSEAMLTKTVQLGAFTGEFLQSGFCSYPAFTFDAEVMENMRDMDEFAQADHMSFADVRDACQQALENVYGGDFAESPEDAYSLSAESRDMSGGRDAIASKHSPREPPVSEQAKGEI